MVILCLLTFVQSSSIASLLWNVRRTIWLVRDSETGAHSTWWPDANVQCAKGYKYPVLVVCWPSVQCGLVWLSRPVCQCARWRPVCAVSGLGLAQPSSGPSPGQPPPLPSPATRTPDHYQHQPHVPTISRAQLHKQDVST